MNALGSLNLTLIIGRYAIDWHQPDLSDHTVTMAVKASRDFWPKSLILPHPSPRNNRWLKTNAWFESDFIPKLQVRVSQLLQ